jgi:hypothetical protein
MRRAIVVKGRVVGPTTVELVEQVPPTGTEVEVEVVVPVGDEVAGDRRESVVEYLRRLPVGMRTKEEIDRQLREEREAWGSR